MKRQIIRMENDIVSVPQFGVIRMTMYELAELFGCYVQIADTHIKVILKSGVIKADISCQLTVRGNTLMPEFFGLDMAIALAFRIHTPQAETFRNWTIRRITAGYTPLPSTLFIQLSKRALCN